MSSTSTDVVRRSVEVLVPVGRAWSVFTEEMGSWWPLATHSIGIEHDAPPDTVVVEGRRGGAIYEVIGADRREWGVVTAWDPPVRLAVEWLVGGTIATQWTATFTPTATGTRVDLVHEGFEAHGERAGDVVSSYGSDGGWKLVLDRFVDAANGS